MDRVRRRVHPSRRGRQPPDPWETQTPKIESWPAIGKTLRRLERYVHSRHNIRASNAVSIAILVEAIAPASRVPFEHEPDASSSGDGERPKPPKTCRELARSPFHAGSLEDAGHRGHGGGSEKAGERERDQSLDERMAALGPSTPSRRQLFALTVTLSRMFARERSPIPRTFRRSSTFLNGPCSFR